MRPDAVDEDAAMGPLGEGRLGAAAWMSVFLLLATIGAAAVMTLAQHGVAGCGQRCDYETLAAGFQAFLILALLPLVIAIPGSYLLRARGWWVLLAPTVGFLTLGLIFTITWTITQDAMHP